MKFTLIHPSRGRPVKSFSTYKQWLEKADNEFQHLLSLDFDDNQLGSYQTNFKDSRILIGHHSNLIQAVHDCIPFIKGEVVLILSDDFDCPEHWDTLLLDQVKDYPKKEFAIYVNDGITFGRKCMTLPILSKALIDKLGYIYYPKYTGMFADDDLYQTCEQMDVIVQADILFQHNHWVNGKAQRDDTYNRHNTDISWKIGQKLLRERQERGFID